MDSSGLRVIERINGLTRRQSLLARPDTAAVAVDRGVDPLERARGQVDLPAPGTMADDPDLAVEFGRARRYRMAPSISPMVRQSRTR